MNYLYFGLVCFFASLLQSIIGFGFAIISMPLLILIFPAKTMAAVLALSSLVSRLQVVYKMKKYINFEIIIIPIIASLVGRTLGINLLMVLNEEILKLILSLTIILIAAYFIFFRKKYKIKANSINGSIFGMLSGVLGGMFNTGGPPIVTYYLSVLSDKYTYAGSIQFTFVIGNLYSVILHTIYGNFDISAISLVLISIFSVTLGSFIGCKVVKKVENINRLVYISMILITIFIIADNLIN